MKYGYLALFIKSFSQKCTLLQAKTLLKYDLLTHHEQTYLILNNIIESVAQLIYLLSVSFYILTKCCNFYTNITLLANIHYIIYVFTCTYIMLFVTIK